MNKDNILEKFTKKQLLEEADCLEQCGDYLNILLIGYSVEELRQYAEENK